MAKCTLEGEALKRLAEHIAVDIKNEMAKKKAVPFNLKDYMNKIYDLVMQRNGDSNLAAAYAKAIPSIANRFQSIDSAFRNYVKGDIINIIDQADLYKDEENNKVLDFLGRVEKVEETPAQKKEIADSTLNAKYIAPVAPPVRGPRNWFQALPESFKTSTTAEALSINPGDPNYNVPHPGEIEKLKNAVQRKVVDLFHGGKVNSNYGVEYEGVDGGIYLTALSDANKKLDYDKLPESRKEYWEKNGGEESFKSNDLGVELVFTDSDGEIIYFDKTLKVTSKEEGWPVILSLRGAKLVGEVDKGVMPIEDFALRLQKTMKLEGQDGYNQAMTEAKRIRAQEEALVKRIRTYLKNNLQESITFPITGGSTGYIETNMENMINVSSIKNIDDFVLSINDKGFATLVMKSTGDEIPVYRNKQTKEFAKTLTEYLLYPVVDSTTNKEITIEEKKQVLANYYNPALVYLDSVSNTLRVKTGSQYIKASLTTPTPESVDLISSALSDYYLDSTIFDPTSKKTVEITKAVYDSKKAAQKLKTFDPSSAQRIVGKFVEKDGKYYQVKQIEAGQNREALQSNQFKSIVSVDLTGTKPKVVYSETIPYSDYVKKTLSTSAQLNGQGNIVKLHPYVNWEIYSGTKADQQVNSNHGAVPTSMTSDAYDKANEVMDSPSDTGIDTESSNKAESVYDTILKNKSLFEKSTRTKINEKKAAKEFLDNAEKWYNSTDLAKHIPFKVTFNAINTANPNAVATWDENGITLLKGSDMSDLYHEAWHGFTQLFLTKEQKDKLYAEAKKQSGSFVDYKGTRVEFKNASNLQLEEHLAEGFREYVISGGKKVLDQTPVRKSIFQKILAFLKSLFGKVSYNQALGEIRSTSAIKDIYEKLYLGSLNEYKFDPRNVEFQVLTKGMEAINEEERNEHSISTRDSLLISNSVDAVISDLTYKLALAKNAAISYNILARADARSLVYKQVKAVFEETLAQKQKELSSVTKDLSGYENYSGNAEGADKYWAQRGYEYGLGKQVDFTTDSYDQLDDELKEETEAAYKTAVSRLGRKELAEDTPAGKLVRRDYLQVKYSDAVFAVSDIILPGEKGKPVKGKRYENNTKKAIVDGGTGYAVQMAIDLGKPVYVFHQGTLADNTTKVGWYEWNGTEFEAMDTPALTQKYAGVGSRQLNDAGKKAIEDVYKFTIDIIEPSANSTSLKKQDLQNQIRILTYAIDNFGDTDNIFKNPFGVGVIGYHRLRSEFLSFEDRFEDELQDERDASGPAFGMGAADQAIEEFLPVEIGYLLRGLKSGKKNALGFDVPLNEKLVIYKFIRTIAGNNGVTDIYNRLVKASEEFTPFKELLVKIGDPMSPVGGIQKIWNAINYVGRVSEAPLKQLTINKISKTYNKEGDLVEVEPTFDIYFGESFGDFQQVQKFWETSFQSSTGRYIKLQDDVRIMNLTNVFADFPTKQSALNNKRGFLEAIGIKFSAAKEIDEKLNEIRPDGNSIGRVDRLYDIAKAYQNEGLYPTSISDLIKDNTDLDPSFTNEYTNYNDLANLELSYSDRFSNFSKKTAEDTIQYTITKNNSIFETVNAINAGETFPTMVSQPQTRHFDTTRNPATRASVLINSLFNLNTGQKRKDRKGNPVKINIDNISGVSLLENSSEFIDGTALSKLDKPSKLVADIHSLLTTGIVENSRHADKPMSYATSASKIHGTGSNGMLYVDTAKFVSPQSGAESFANIMMRYLIAEHDRINILKNLPDNDPAVNTPLFDKAGREFVIFHGILTEEIKKKLYAIETDPYKGSSLLEYLGYAYNDGALVPVSNTDEQIALREEIKDDIKEYFRLKSASLENLYSETNIFDNNLFKSVRKESLRLNINSELLTNDNIKSAIVSSYFANKLINNIELGILVYGDPSQYTHPKFEYSKRIALFGSAGPQPRYDEGFINYVNSDQFGGKKYGKTRGVDKPLSSILNTAVISDDVVNSPFKEKFVERAKIEIGKKFALRRDSIWVNASKEEKEEIIAKQAELQYSAYDGMKTNDSQALITFDTYRFIAFALKDWTQQQEDMYQDIIAGKPINRAEVDQVFPVMKLQYAGPLMTNSLPLMAGHKYSLFPLIPSVIKGTKLEQVHNMMIDQNIDYVVPVSGSKISSITKNGKPDQLYVNGVINTDTEFTNNPIFIGYLKKQMNVEPYFKGKSRFATQLRKLGTLGLYDGGVPSDFMPDTQDSSAKRLAWEALSESEKETYSNYRINKEYEESLDRLMEFIQDDLLNEIDWKIIDGVPQGSMENLLKLIEREFIRRGKPMDSLDFLQVDKNGKLVRDLSILSDSGNVERMLIALAEKRLIRQKLKGEGLIQVANSMFEKADYVRFKKPTEEQLKNYGADDLLYYDFTINPNGTYTNTSAAQVKVALQGDFKKLLQHKHNDGKPIKTLDRLNAMLKNEKWLNTGDNRKMITIISARIPVGERNFVEFFEVAQFLPEEAGPIMVVPKELVAKNGGDFDFDKQMSLLPTIERVGDNIKYLQSEVTEAQAQGYYNAIKEKNKDFDRSFVDFYTKLNIGAASNSVLQNLRSIFERPENFIYLTNSSSNYIFDDIVKKYKEEGLESGSVTNYQVDARGNKTKFYTADLKEKASISPTTAFEPEFDLETHSNNNVGKDVVGIVASANGYAPVANRVGLYMNPTRGTGTYEEYIKAASKEPRARSSYDKEVYKTFRLQRLFLDHNSLIGDANGKLSEKGTYKMISLSNLNDVNNNNPNSEVGSQTLNGGLDVAKDPWLFYININKEAAPVLMFLKQAGVDIENAIALINQPIIKEYLRLLKAVKSPVAAIQGIEPSNPNYYRLKAREIILNDPKYGFNQSLDVVAGPGSPSRIYELLLNYTEGYSSADFTLDSLNASKSLEFGDAKVKAILAHYIELEETSKFYSKLIRNTSMDTSTESSLISAINKDLMFGDLYSDNAFPKEKLDMIASESQISSFFNRKLIVGLYKDLFEFRDHPKIIEFLTKKLKSSEFKEFANAAYGDEIENALAGFQDAVTNYVFQKALVNVNLVDGYYKGITSRDSIKTKKVGEIVSFPAAVIVENGVPVMYYNMDIINRQYEKAWSRTFPTLRSYQTYVFEKAYQKHINSFDEYAESQDFKERKTKLKETAKRRANEIQKEKLSDKRLLPLTDVARFKQLSGKGRELETYFPTDYIKKSGYPQSTTFVLNENGLYDLINQATGEIFNSNVDLKDGFEYNVNVVKNIAESKKDYNDRLNRLTYDGYLTSVALKNTFNIYHLFYSNESFAQEFYNFKAKYPKLSDNYMIFSILEKSNSKTSDLQNLVIKGGQLDGKSLDIIHDNIRELANYNKMLVEAPKFGITDKLEIAKLADMFKRFTYFAYLQSGIGGKGAFAIQNLGLQGLYSNLMTSPSNPNNPGSRSVLKNFTETMNEDLLNTIYEKFKDNVSSERKFRLQNYETRVITRPASEDKFNAYTEGVLLYDGSNFDNSGLAENYFLNAIDNYRLSGGDPSNLVFVINTAVKKKTGKQDYLKSILKDTGATLIAIPVREDFNEKTHFKDETLADNQARIDAVLEELAKERASGKVLVMSNLGYGQNMIGLSEITGKSIPGTGGAQDTFVHLSKELYKKFGYLNNNFKERPEFDIEETDDQTVRDFLSICLTSGLL